MDMKYYVIKGMKTIYEGICDKDNHNIVNYYRPQPDGTFASRSVEDKQIGFEVDLARKQKKLVSFPNLQMAINFVNAKK